MPDVPAIAPKASFTFGDLQYFYFWTLVDGISQGFINFLLPSPIKCNADAHCFFLQVIPTMYNMTEAAVGLGGLESPQTAPGQVKFSWSRA